MRKITFAIIVSGLFSMGFAQTVDTCTARRFAEQCMLPKYVQKNAAAMELYYTDVDHQQAANPVANFYVFNRKGGGFIIVSADRRCKPVLAYSPTGTFDTTDMPDNLRSFVWLFMFRIRSLPNCLFL